MKINAEDANLWAVAASMDRDLNHYTAEQRNVGLAYVSQQSEIEALREQVQRRDLLLQGLTPGGSEYVNDPERCVAYAREVRVGYFKLWKETALAEKAAEKRARVAEKVTNDEFQRSLETEARMREAEAKAAEWKAEFQRLHTRADAAEARAESADALVVQAGNRIGDLEALVAELKAKYEQMWATAKAWEPDELRKALEFYANPANWIPTRMTPVPAIDMDGGQRASAALKKVCIFCGAIGCSHDQGW